jgi:hypothetical protein
LEDVHDNPHSGRWHTSSLPSVATLRWSWQADNAPNVPLRESSQASVVHRWVSNFGMRLKWSEHHRVDSLPHHDHLVGHVCNWGFANSYLILLALSYSTGNLNCQLYEYPVNSNTESEPATFGRGYCTPVQSLKGFRYLSLAFDQTPLTIRAHCGVPVKNNQPTRVST